MQNGRVVSANDMPGFTTDRAAAAQSLRLPMGIRGASASPYFCLSDFVKNWPSNAENQSGPQSQQPTHKARIVLMITNGVDPYNGSTNITNQNSPYVATAVTDAQRAGVPVYSIYYNEVGFGRGRGSFSGQSYLPQVAQGTGGATYYQGTGNPVSLAPVPQAIPERPRRNLRRHLPRRRQQEDGHPQGLQHSAQNQSQRSSGGPPRHHRSLQSITARCRVPDHRVPHPFRFHRKMGHRA